jgi:hypothetical protein
MNTPISFEIAKLLKEKGFDKLCNTLWHFNGSNYIEMSNKNSENFGFSSPTIAEVVYWIYEKHEIWIEVGAGSLFHKDKFYILIKEYRVDRWELTSLDNKIHSPYNSPTKAYEAAIEYTLNNLIIL